jgi:hydrogenase nickel incorporation protein HypB
MCSTCGCGEAEGGVIILTAEEQKQLKHHAHHHGHGDHHHHHPHDHEHSHDHPHTQTKTVVEIQEDILNENQKMAERNRGYFEARKIRAFNLVSSPGSGKTSLLEYTLNELKNEHTFYVIEGDQQTFNDANRIDAIGIPVAQINTGKGCHLDSSMVRKAIDKLNPSEGSFLMIENVGNLVCPALFDLGESSRIVIASVTEGDDKPIKYPDMFHTSDVCLINKIDLLPYVSFDVETFKDYALRVNPDMHFFEVSATTGEGMDKWFEWLTKSHYHVSGHTG